MIFMMEDDMNINPDKVKELVLLFAELDNEYQKELLKQAYILFFKQSQKNLIQTEGKKFKSDDEYKSEIEKGSQKTAKESLEMVELFYKIGYAEKAQLLILLDKLSNGKLTQKTDIEIKINQQKISLKEYIEGILPGVDVEQANEKVVEFLKEEGGE